LAGRRSLQPGFSKRANFSPQSLEFGDLGVFGNLPVGSADAFGFAVRADDDGVNAF
jgi:hypothetical protein